MPADNVFFLAPIIAAFAAFMLVLGGVSFWSNLKEPR